MTKGRKVKKRLEKRIADYRTTVARLEKDVGSTYYPGSYHQPGSNKK